MSFIKELVKAIIVSVVIVPLTFIGLASGGLIYDRKVEPWLKGKLKIE